MKGRTVTLLTVLLCGQAFGGTVTVEVDASADRHPISPEIYGLNGGTEAQLRRMGVTVRRWGGGNPSTRYNWKNQTANRARDWYFQSVPGSQAPVDPFVSATLGTGARPMVVLTTIGWISKGDGRTRYCGFSIAKYGAQRARAPDNPDCGDGHRPGTPPGQDNWITANPDPTDTSFAADHTWAAEWVAHLAPLGVHDFQLDNEPGIWNSTHHDVHPDRTTYDEMRRILSSYGPAVKAADPQARIFGPVSWGWSEYLHLSYVAGNNPDHDAHGDFIPWYLAQAKAWSDNHGGQRILDVLDLHYYPQDQSNGVSIYSEDVDAATSAARLRSTRSLWDPTYTDPTWIGTQVRLIPRMKEWVARHYPGTRTALTEYSFGAIDTPNGALTQADALGIFGREGLDYATLFWEPSPDSIGEDSFKLFRNYDGAGGRFGDTSVRAVSSSVDAVTAYVSEVSPGKLAIVLVNKDTSPSDVTVNLAGVGGGGAYRAFGFGSSRLAAAGTGSANGASFTRTIPARTVEVLEYRADGFAGCGCSSGAGTAVGLVPLAALALARWCRSLRPGRTGASGRGTRGS